MAKIIVTREIPEVGLSLLREANHEVIVAPHDRVLEKQELLEIVQGADAVLSLLTDTIDSEVFDAAGNQLKIVSNYAVGFNNIDLDEAKKRGITITNTPEVLSDAVAEFALALMLAISKRVVEADKFVRENQFKGWAPQLFLGTELDGKILGIVGTGRIGSLFAEKAHRGLKMSVIYHDIQKNEILENTLEAVQTPLDNLLEIADVISVHVPLNEHTHHLLNKEKLSKIKKSAYLINTSRGPVIDENALYEILKEEKIAGAALDVFENEPELTQGLAELDNVIVTPHIASGTIDTRNEMATIAAQNIINVLNGEDPQFQIV